MFNKILLRTFFIGLAILLLLLFVSFLSFPSCQTPCGCCPDYTNPGLHIRLYGIEIHKKSQLQSESCVNVGCGPLVRIFFIDLLLGSLFTFLLSLRGLSLRRKHS